MLSLGFLRVKRRSKGSKKKRGLSSADGSELPLSPEFREDVAACAGKD